MRLNAQTIEAINAAKAMLIEAGMPAELFKADTLSLGDLSPTSTQGLVAYDLEGPSKKLYPILTPLRNRIPRVGGTGTAHNWRAITAIDPGQIYPGVPEGARAPVMAVTVKEFARKYATLGKEGSVTYEQQSAGRTFEDAQALGVMVTLQAAMRDEEQTFVGGNATLALGTTPTPTLSSSGTGSSLTNVAHTVRCVALTHMAWMRSRIANGRGVPMTITHTDPVTGVTTAHGGGAAKISAAATTTPAAGAHIFASVTPVRGAVAYAWFIGTADGASCKLTAITTINSVDLTAIDAGITPGTYYGATAADFTTNNTDNSTNSLVFDGEISLLSDPTSGAYYKALATGTAGTGTGLTGDNAAGIVEWDELFQYQWDNFRLGANEYLVSGQDAKRAKQKVIGGGGSALYRFVVDRDGKKNPEQMQIVAGAKLGDYLNPFTGQLVPVTVHPDVPPGTQIFWTDQLPYQASEVTSVHEVVARREYYDIAWPARTRRYEHGTYVEEVLCNYASFAGGIITNCANV